MTNSTEKKDSSVDAKVEKVTPLRCLIGSVMSGSLAIALYFLTYSIAHTFATKPVTSTNQLVVRISAAVRTLVVGVASLGTFLFGFVALGLILLAIQLSIQTLKESNRSGG
jgi:type III secretory pathway component EscU